MFKKAVVSRMGYRGIFRVVSCCLALLLPAFAQVSVAAEAPPSGPPPKGEDKAVMECMEKGQEALRNEKLDEAIAAFEECAKNFPKSVSAQFSLGMVYFFKHDAEKALAQFKKVLSLDKDNIDATAMVGRIYSFDKAKLSAAKELLERSLAARPESLDIRFDLARVYGHLGDVERAFAEFSMLLEQESKFPLFRTELARLLMAGGAAKEAKMMLERALVLDPNFEPAKKLLEELKKGEKPKE